MRPRSRKTEQSKGGHQTRSVIVTLAFCIIIPNQKYEYSLRVILTSIKQKSRGQLCSYQTKHTYQNSSWAIYCALMNQWQCTLVLQIVLINLIYTLAGVVMGVIQYIQLTHNTFYLLLVGSGWFIGFGTYNRMNFHCNIISSEK